MVSDLEIGEASVERPQDGLRDAQDIRSTIQHSRRWENILSPPDPGTVTPTLKTDLVLAIFGSPSVAVIDLHAMTETGDPEKPF